MYLPSNQIKTLGVIASSKGEISGTEVVNTLSKLARSSVYASLISLQRKTFITARWDFSNNHPRRMYKITALGSEVLRTLHTSESV